MVGCGDDGGDDGTDTDAGSETDAGTETDSGTAEVDCTGPTALPVTCACTLADGSECADGMCFTYNNGAMHCTIACANDQQCMDLGSPGCSGMGVCQRPGG
ncbi:MAG: hypothetical protein AAGC55_03220 [Myxococcota bacterium]